MQAWSPSLQLATSRIHISWIFLLFFSLSGIFSRLGKKSLLRVVEVDLNIAELLPSMIKQASNVITCIVAMTNALYSLALPAAFDQVRAEAREVNDAAGAPVSPVGDEIPLDDVAVAKEVATLIEPDIAVVSPPLQPKVRGSLKRNDPSMPELNLKREDELDSDEEATLLSPESCESLVDYVLHDSVHVLGPSKAKRARLGNLTLPGSKAEPVVKR